MLVVAVWPGVPAPTAGAAPPAPSLAEISFKFQILANQMRAVHVFVFPVQTLKIASNKVHRLLAFYIYIYMYILLFLKEDYGSLQENFNVHL